MPHAASTRIALLTLSLLAAQVATAAPEPSAPPEGAIALRGEPPEWLTPDVRERAREASASGLAYDHGSGAAVAMASASFAFIRPGALMVWPSICTIGFVYGSPGAYQLVTAGHCVDVGDRVIVASAPSLVFEIGTVVFSTEPAPGTTGPDYARIMVDDRWQSAVDADVAGLGGPEGGVDAQSVDPEHPAAVKFIGWGGASTTRAGVVTRESSDGVFYCVCPVSVGDSGGPVLSITHAPLGGSAYLTGQGFGIIGGVLPSPRETAWGTRLTVVGSDLVAGDVNPAPRYCPPAPSQPPNGVAIMVCGDTGYATLTATSTVTECASTGYSWSCDVIHRVDVSVSDLSGCAHGDGLTACSILFVPASASASTIARYGSIPPGGRTVHLWHTLCLSEATGTYCDSAMEAVRLPGPPQSGGLTDKIGGGVKIRVSTPDDATYL